MRLTPLEAEILRHRLQVPDAIHDSLSAPWTADEVADACNVLLAGLPNVAGLETQGVSGLIADVLENCVAFSTYAGASTEESDEKQRAIVRAGRSLAEKIGQLIGSSITFPEW